MRHMVLGFLVGVLVAAMVGGLLFFRTNPVSQSLFGNRVLIVEPADKKMTRAELDQVRNFIRKGYISKPDELITALTSFYDSVIVLLIAINGIVGVLAYLSVRGLSRRSAEDMAKDSAHAAVSQYFDSLVFNKLLMQSVQEELGEIKGDAEKVMEALSNKQEELETILQRAQEVIANNDRTEEVQDGTVELNKK